MPQQVSEISMQHKVDATFTELQTAAEKHSIAGVLKEIDQQMRSLSGADWKKFSGKLESRLGRTQVLLPELELLATEDTFSKALASGKSLTDSEIQKKIDIDKSLSKNGATPFSDFLLQCFVTNDFKWAKNESTFGAGDSVSKGDLEAGFNTIAALSLLEKNNGEIFKQLADTNAKITTDSSHEALNKDSAARQAGHPGTLSKEARAVAEQLTDQYTNHDLFKKLANIDYLFAPDYAPQASLGRH